MALIFRKDKRSYMNIGTIETPAWALIGEGFTDFSTDFGATEDERHYVHEKTARTLTTGFAKTTSYSMDMYSEDPVCRRIALAHKLEQTGTDSNVEVMTVDYFDPGFLENTYFAKKQTFSISPSTEAEGNGGNVLELSGSLNAMGDPVFGSWSGTLDREGIGEFTPAKEADYLPGAPTEVSAIPGEEKATVSFTAPQSTGGMPIIGYIVTAKPELGQTVTVSGAESPIEVGGLIGGTEYSVTVSARNAAGTGPESESASVTPTPATP